MRVAKRVTHGRHRPTSGMPLGRIMAGMMLASLISTLFALPAFAAANQIDFNVTSSVPKVLPSGAYSYTVTVTNNSGVDADTLDFTDTLTGGGVMTSAVPSAGSCTAIVANVTDCSFPTLLSGASATVTINATAPGSIGTGTNTVSAFTDTQLDTANGTLFADTTVENADLQVTKTHAPASVSPGAAFTYTITVKNNGPSDAAGVTLADAAPAGVTFGTVQLSASPSGSYTCAGATATSLPCALGLIPSGTTVTLLVNATLALSATGVVSNTASASSSTLDAVPANNSATDPLTPASADLLASLAANPTTASPGDTVTFTVGVQNLDAVNDATNVVVTDTLPTGLTAVSPPTAPSSGAAAVVGNVWTWTLPTVAKSSTITATFDVTVDQGTALPTITNTVGITKADQGDPNLANNTASVDLTISPAVADLDVLTAVNNSKPAQGDQIKIAIQVSNTGPADATNVVLKDVLANGLKYVSCTPCSGGGLRRSTSRQWSIATIPASSAATIVLTVTVQASSGTLKNTASIVSADQTDPNGANDHDTLQITVGGTNNSGGGGNGGSGGGSGGTGGTSASGGSTAFTGFTANQLLPWLMLFATLGLVALEFARRRPAVAAIGHTYGFDPWV